MRPTTLALILVGGLFGTGIFVFVYGSGLSYLSKKPEACVNCHIMNHQYDTWSKSAHHLVATCNDCHLDTGLVGRWVSKAKNGWNHSVAFTLENFAEPIQMTESNKKILQENCVRCHTDLVHDAILVPAGGSSEAQSCTHCHKQIGHYPLN